VSGPPRDSVPCSSCNLVVGVQRRCAEIRSSQGKSSLDGPLPRSPLVAVQADQSIPASARRETAREGYGCDRSSVVRHVFLRVVAGVARVDLRSRVSVGLRHANEEVHETESRMATDTGLAIRPGRIPPVVSPHIGVAGFRPPGPVRGSDHHVVARQLPLVELPRVT